MEVFGIYLLKSSAIVIMFWVIYALFLRKETTFMENRYFLLLGSLAALLLPLVKIKQTIVVQLAQATNTMSIPDENGSEVLADTTLNGFTIALWIYLLGCAFFLGRFLLQIRSIRSLLRHAHIWKEDDLKHVETKRTIAPFSFFKSIYYYPQQFEITQLNAILQHEKVHARQWHSIDVILSEFVKILLWFNPVVWLYQKTIQQNLEFLADAHAVHHVNKTSYQYLMVNQAVGQQFSITNSFYNSLIKKRIVMLNKNQSKRMNAFKTFLVLPLLAIFLLSFAIEKEYQFKTSTQEVQLATDEKVEVIIDKNTTDEDLLKIKSDLAKDAIDFSYTTVRNDAKEIIDISVQVSGKGKNGATFSNSHSSSNSEKGISPLVIFIDLSNNMVSIGSKGAYSSEVVKLGNSTSAVWISSDEDEDHKKEFIIKKDKGKHKIFVNGEEVDPNDIKEKRIEFHTYSTDENDDKRIKIHVDSEDDEGENVFVIKKATKFKTIDTENGKNVMIITDSEDDNDVEVQDEGGFFFVDAGGTDPLFVIDGVETTRKKMKKLKPNKIETIEVLKGEKAKEKYGKKGKNGVVEITTKKGK